MDGEKDLKTLIERSGAFVRCPTCGRTVVKLGPHRCPESSERSESRREDRERLADDDDREGQSPVGLVQRAAGNAYAYHELEDGEPLCGCLGQTTAEGVTVVSRSEAKARGKSPCGNCEKILSTRSSR